MGILGLTGVLPVVAWLWRAVNPIGAVDVTVMVRDEAYVQLPAATESLPLRLTYADKQFRSAMLFDVAVANTGSESVGGTRRWQVRLRHPDRLPLLQLGPVRQSPARIGDSIPVTTADGAVELDIGLLNRNDEVSVRLLALDHPSEFLLPVLAEVSPVPNLNRVVVERGSTLSAVHSRIQNRLGWPLFVVGAVGLFVLWIREQRAQSTNTIVRGLPQAAFIVVFGGAMLAFGASWLLAWLGVLALRAV
jgi:hypothetical protein